MCTINYVHLSHIEMKLGYLIPVNFFSTSLRLAYSDPSLPVLGFPLTIPSPSKMQNSIYELYYWLVLSKDLF